MKFRYILVVDLFLFCFAELTWESLRSNCYDNSNVLPEVETDCTNLISQKGQFCCFAELTKKDSTKSNEEGKKKICLDSYERSPILGKSNDDKINEIDKIAIGNITCAKRSTILNNCGHFGNSEPTLLTHCTEIIIPESLCCLIKVKNSTGAENRACRRFDELPSEKEIKDKSLPLISQLKKDGFELTSIECALKFIKISLAIFSLYLFCFF